MDQTGCWLWVWSRLGGPADPDFNLSVAGLWNVQEVPAERLGWKSRRGGTWEAQGSGCLSAGPEVFQYVHNQDGSTSVFQLNICLGSIKNFFFFIIFIFQVEDIAAYFHDAENDQKRGQIGKCDVREQGENYRTSLSWGVRMGLVHKRKGCF